jgi:hypothetical protein
MNKKRKRKKNGILEIGISPARTMRHNNDTIIVGGWSTKSPWHGVVVIVGLKEVGKTQAMFRAALIGNLW